MGEGFCSYACIIYVDINISIFIYISIMRMTIISVYIEKIPQRSAISRCT